MFKCATIRANNYCKNYNFWVTSKWLLGEICSVHLKLPVVLKPTYPLPTDRPMATFEARSNTEKPEAMKLMATKRSSA